MTLRRATYDNDAIEKKVILKNHSNKTYTVETANHVFVRDFLGFLMCILRSRIFVWMGILIMRRVMYYIFCSYSVAGYITLRGLVDLPAACNGKEEHLQFCLFVEYFLNKLSLHGHAVIRLSVDRRSLTACKLFIARYGSSAAPGELATGFRWS